MLTKLSKILIGVFAVVLIAVAITYYAQAFLLQQKEIGALQGTRRAIIAVPVATATGVPTATPSAGISLVKPIVTPGITSTVIPTGALK